MRLLYIHQYFNTLEMPGGTRSYEMAVRFARDGCEVNVVTARVDGKYKQYVRERVDENLVVHWLPVTYSNKMGFWSRLFSFLVFSIKASVLSVKIKSDIVFATSTPLTVIIPAAIVVFFKKIPLVFEVRDLWPETAVASGMLTNPFLQFLARRMERFAYRVSHSVIALSPGIKEGILSSSPNTKVTIIPNSADLELFQKFNTVKLADIVDGANSIFSKPVILYAGTIGRVNGLEYLVDLAFVLRDKANILVVGDGGQKNNIIRYAMLKGVNEGNFFVRPFVPKKYISEVFRASSVATNITAPVDAYKNNSANKFFDSLASGVPIIVNQEGWMADLVREYKAGFVVSDFVDCPDYHSLLEEISNLDQLAIRGANALFLAKDQFDREKLYQVLRRQIYSAAQDKTY